MAIEVDIPIEIEEYQEKIIFGMSLRQLVCFVSAVALGIGSYFLFTKGLGLSMDITSYIIILEALPLGALGFIKKDGQPFEKYFYLFVRQQTGKNKLSYAVHPDMATTAPGSGERKSKYAWIFEKEASNSGKQLSRREQRAEASRKEADIFFPTEKDRKRNRKETRAKIKAAQKDLRAVQRRAKKESQERRRAEERS